MYQAPMPLDPLEERVLLREIINMLAEGVPEEARDRFVELAVVKLNRMAPLPGKKQKRNYIRSVE